MTRLQGVAKEVPGAGLGIRPAIEPQANSGTKDLPDAGIPIHPPLEFHFGTGKRINLLFITGYARWRVMFSERSLIGPPWVAVSRLPVAKGSSPLLAESPVSCIFRIPWRIFIDCSTLR